MRGGYGIHRLPDMEGNRHRCPDSDLRLLEGIYWALSTGAVR